MKILVLDSSIRGEDSFTRRLTAAIAQRILVVYPHAQLFRRDLCAPFLPHLKGSPDLAEAQQSVSLLEEFLQSDVIVVGAPMYNFTIPSQLKSWIDHIAVAGKTFRYTSAGPEGLCAEKRVIVATAAGGVHGPEASTNFVDPYLKLIFGFLGINRIEFVRVEGISLGEGEVGLANALEQVSQLT